MTTTTPAVPAGQPAAKPSRLHRFRDWWNGLSRPEQWLWLIPIVAFMYVVPVLKIPLINTEPGYPFPNTMFDCARFALAEFKGATVRPIRMAYFADGHAAVTAEKTIQEQCAPPSAPGIGPVP